VEYHLCSFDPLCTFKVGRFGKKPGILSISVVKSFQDLAFQSTGKMHEEKYLCCVAHPLYVALFTACDASSNESLETWERVRGEGRGRKRNGEKIDKWPRLHLKMLKAIYSV
jgi:hypothetical protein